MKKQTVLVKMIMLAMMIAIGVTISPILRIEGMCPMSSLVNVVCAVLLGPWYALLCATMVGIIRMLFMGIPPLALTGSVFGALLAGLLYRAFGKRLIFASLGEFIGTGLIGAIVSYPVMTYFWGKGGLTLFIYVPIFLGASAMGGAAAYILLKVLQKNGLLIKFQRSLGVRGV